MQPILIATDFSDIAKNATQYAIDAAKVVRVKVILFHLYKVSSHMANSLISSDNLNEMAGRKKEQFETYAQELSVKNGVDVSIVVKVGDFMDEVANVAAEYNCSMLVMGMPKKTFELELLGNTTTAAIYKFKFPILSIPETSRFNGIHKILYACDYRRRGIHAGILQTVKEYARLFRAEVQVLYIGDALKQAAGKEEIDAGFKGISYWYKQVQSDSVVKAIQEEAEHTGADILIMTPNKYGFWASLLHRSKTRAMASNGKIPLLSIAY